MTRPTRAGSNEDSKPKEKTTWVASVACSLSWSMTEGPVNIVGLGHTRFQVAASLRQLAFKERVFSSMVSRIRPTSGRRSRKVTSMTPQIRTVSCSGQRNSVMNRASP